MIRNEQAEYMLDAPQLLKQFAGKWVIWGVVSLLVAGALVAVNYRSQKSAYAEYQDLLAAYNESFASPEDLGVEPIDPEKARAKLSESSLDTVENALTFYQIAQDRKDYREHSALNQLDANNAKSLVLRYRSISDNNAADTEALKQFALSDDFSSVVAEAVEQYQKEYVSEILSATVAGTLVTITIWLPEDADEEDILQKCDRLVTEFGTARGAGTETYSLALESYDVKHTVYPAVTKNIQDSTNNVINAQNTLASYLSGMDDNELAVYHAEFGEAYYPKSVEKGKAEEPEEPEAVAPPAFKPVLAVAGFLTGLALCLLVYICYVVLSGRVYSRAIERTMGLDYSADLWIKEKAHGKAAERSSFDSVSENVNELGAVRGLCFVEVGEIRTEMRSTLSELEDSVDQLISLDRMQILDQPVLPVADAIGSHETEIIILADVKRVRYGKLAKVVYEFRNLGFARISCICLH